jgi:mannose-6-phosphate isomerase-like protein (cupin superfamily)
METTTVAHPLIVDHEALTDLPVAPIGDLQGVERKILWRGEESEAGVLVVFPGHQLGAHTHRSNHHHLWVLDGRATILGTEVGPGSFVHVPSGVEHDIDARQTNGCAVFYVYAPSGS